jgi:hypothetical protein
MEILLTWARIPVSALRLGERPERVAASAGARAIKMASTTLGLPSSRTLPHFYL